MILTVAFYDQDTGDITEITQAPRASLVADRRPYVDLPEWRRNWDVTHRVRVESDHTLVEREA
jgi:hypothetical protein